MGKKWLSQVILAGGEGGKSAASGQIAAVGGKDNVNTVIERRVHIKNYLRF